MSVNSTPVHGRVVFHKERARKAWQRNIDCALRRAVDVIAAAAGLLVLSPLFALIAWRIRRDSPGPVFYWGPRVGRHGKLFCILKFRTMYERPDSYEGPGITGN